MNEDRRITELERRLVKLEDRTENMGVTGSEIRNLWKAMDSLKAELGKEVSELKDELSGARRALYTMALSVAGGVLTSSLIILGVFK